LHQIGMSIYILLGKSVTSWSYYGLLD